MNETEQLTKQVVDDACHAGTSGMPDDGDHDLRRVPRDVRDAHRDALAALRELRTRMLRGADLLDRYTADSGQPTRDRAALVAGCIDKDRSRWHTTNEGTRAVKKVLRKVLQRQQLPTLDDLFDRAYTHLQAH